MVKPPKVSMWGDKYILEDGGNHRIAASQELNRPIEVSIIGEHVEHESVQNKGDGRKYAARQDVSDLLNSKAAENEVKYASHHGEKDGIGQEAVVQDKRGEYFLFSMNEHSPDRGTP